MPSCGISDLGLQICAYLPASSSKILFPGEDGVKWYCLPTKAAAYAYTVHRGSTGEPFQDFFKKRTFLIPHKMSVQHMLAHMFFSRI